MSAETHSRRWLRPLLAVAAIATGFGLASGFVSVLVLFAGLGWYVSSSAPVAVLPVDDSSLDHVLVDAPEADPGFTEPVREEVPVRRSRRVAAPAAAPVAEPAVAEAGSDEPAGATHAEPSGQDAIRLLRARMASGELDVVEGEAGRTSVDDG